jgi:hypothetical protein
MKSTVEMDEMQKTPARLTGTDWRTTTPPEWVLPAANSRWLEVDEVISLIGDRLTWAAQFRDLAGWRSTNEDSLIGVR